MGLGIEGPKGDQGIQGPIGLKGEPGSGSFVSGKGTVSIGPPGYPGETGLKVCDQFYTCIPIIGCNNT